MRSPASDAPPGVLVEAVPPLSSFEAAASYLGALGAMAHAELQRLRHEPTVIFTRAAQPLLWLLVFGAALSRVRALPTDGVPYQAFLVPGVVAQSVLFVAIFSGLAIIWERDLGITQRVLVTPVPRSAVILGKALGSGVRAAIQVTLVLAAVAAFRIPLLWSPLRLAAVLAVTVLGAVLFAAMSMVIASGVGSREQFMGLGQLVTLPLFFASNALYAISIMPEWLRGVALVNPLTYEVELLRRLMLGVGPDRPLVDLAVLIGVSAVAVAIASRTYPRRVM